MGGRIHAAVTWILPSQSAQTCSVGYPDHMIRGAPYRFINHLSNFLEGRDVQSSDQLVVKLVLVRKMHEYSTGTFLTISMSPAMLSSLSLSRSIAVWKVNFQVRVVCDVMIPHPPQVQVHSYLDNTLPICEVSFPGLQGGKDSRNILNSP